MSDFEQDTHYNDDAIFLDPDLASDHDIDKDIPPEVDIDVVRNASKPITWQVNTPVKVADAIRRTRQVNFLKAFAECGNLSTACKAAGINLSTERSWRNRLDLWYQEHLKDAIQQYSDLVRQTVHDRAIHGVREAIIGKVQTQFGPEDQIIGYRQKYDNLLLMFHAKKIDHSYRDKEEMRAEDIHPDDAKPISRITARLNEMAERNVIDIEPGNSGPPLLTQENSGNDPS